MSYFWSGVGGVPGDFAYGTMHLMATIILIVVAGLLCYVGRKLSMENRRKVLVVVAFFALALEIFWRGKWIGRGLPMAELWPLYPCNLGGVLVPLIALFNNKTLKNLFYVLALVGGVVTFIYPLDVFINSELSFDIIKNILQHMFIITIPLFEFVTGQYKPQFKKVWIAMLAIFIYLFNGEVITRWLGLDGDYVFLRAGLPFVIPGVPQVITFGLVVVFGLVVIYAALDPKGCKTVLKRKNTRNKPKKS
jgi:hypothetical integral membrane protein (TIGR02206 family)